MKPYLNYLLSQTTRSVFSTSGSSDLEREIGSIPTDPDDQLQISFSDSVDDPSGENFEPISELSDEDFSSDHSEYVPGGSDAAESDSTEMSEVSMHEDTALNVDTSSMDVLDGTSSNAIVPSETSLECSTTSAETSSRAEPSKVDEQSTSLDGMESFAEETKHSRKRKRCPEKWKRNIIKHQRASGQAYVSSSKREIPAAAMREPCRNCRFKCHEKISEGERLEIFQGYYGLADYTRQREFLGSHTIRKPKNTLTTTAITSRRKNSITYHLPQRGDKIRVCKTMFINTLGINKGVVDIAMTKQSSLNVIEADQRGKHVKCGLSASLVQKVKQHIQSFPVVPSHYCREKTTRKYLDSSLNITMMYRLYCEFCDNRGEEKVTVSMYRKIFNENFNLGFHNPKKDQCRVCNHYDNADTEVKNSLKDEHMLHLARKERVRSEKGNDKLLAAQSNGKLVCASFGLQQVLQVPYDPKNNALFYKRKLSTYNFTIYDMVSKQGNCFMWNETEGGRGSCEIASSIYVFLKSLPVETTEVVFYSDRCGGQNLNKFVAAMFLLAVQEMDHIEKVDHKFLVSGHSEMECDSMHSAIGTELKRVGQASWPEDLKQNKLDAFHEIRSLSNGV
ncbi:uncharacterized protein LOC134291697 [Aedes albopictus]|uniref:Uncharacterized protein n=1 Tax=Aedes albopictus TaxID=7160 RepID=A0ABM1XWQ9_AEDAL